MKKNMSNQPKKIAIHNSIQATRVQEAITILNRAIENKTSISEEALLCGKDRRFVNNVSVQILGNPHNLIPVKVKEEFNRKYANFSRKYKPRKKVKKVQNQNPVNTPTFNTSNFQQTDSNVKVEFHANLPIPVNTRGKKPKPGSKYQFEKLKIGHAAVYQIADKKDYKRITQSASLYAKRKGIKLLTAIIDKTRVGVWRLSKAEAKLRNR